MEEYAHLNTLRLHTCQLCLHAPGLLPSCACIVLRCYKLQPRAAKLASLPATKAMVTTKATLTGHKCKGASCPANGQAGSEPLSSVVLDKQNADLQGDVGV